MRKIVFAVIFSFSGWAVAGLEEGMEAYDRGDTAAAVREFEKLPVKNGFVLYNLGVLYANGDGVRKDVKTAVGFYRQAAELSGPDKLWTQLSLHNLGRMHEVGDGLTQDYAEAARCYRGAAELGHAPSQFNLAVLYVNGNGVPVSLPFALHWVLKAEASGETKAPRLRKILEKQMEKSGDKT
jgi:uncharacterized protein